MTSELQWYCYLFRELGIKLDTPPTLLCIDIRDPNYLLSKNQNLVKRVIMKVLRDLKILICNITPKHKENFIETIIN